jgi:hypothetical protein
MAYVGHVNSAVVTSRWGKYDSTLKAFAYFEAFKRSSFSWPLFRETCRLFIVWFVSIRKLQPSSIQSYISALKFLHHLRGLSCEQLTDDHIWALTDKSVTSGNGLTTIPEC